MRAGNKINFRQKHYSPINNISKQYSKFNFNYQTQPKNLFNFTPIQNSNFLFSKRFFCSTVDNTTPPLSNAIIEQTPSPTLSSPESKSSLLPREVVQELNRFIIGQEDAKKAVAVALRNRWRRKQLGLEVKEEIMPKNILMIGSTGVGKTEIARRLAKMCNAPFIKVEATKYTEVGFHGRDVDQIIRDLVDVGINDVKKQTRIEMKVKIEQEVEKRLLDCLTGKESRGETREQFAKMLKDGTLEGSQVEVEVSDSKPISLFDTSSSPLGGGVPTSNDVNNLVKSVKESFMRSGSKVVKMTVAEARPVLEKIEGDRLLDNDSIIRLAIEQVEQEGIVFIDEIDKICRVSGSSKDADASSEGVQRDLLPLIEGSIINTKNGNVDTSKILFIASGAFYSCKPSDLLPELQGRLPIRVELKPLSENDLFRILTEPEMNLIDQQIELLKTEGINLVIGEDSIKEVARIAAEVNRTIENIGARRLHTVIEKIIEDISFNCDEYSGDVVISKEMITAKLEVMLKKSDFKKFIL